MVNQKVTRKLPLAVPLAAYYALIFMNNGAFVSYIGVYYASIDLSNMDIGLLTSVGAIVVMVSQPVWGVASDRARYKNRVLTAALLLSAASIWLTPLAGSNLWLLFLAAAVFSLFQRAVNPLSDAIALELAGEGHFRFSLIRTVGSLGFALMSAAAGGLFEYDIRLIFVVVSFFMLGASLLSLQIPLVRGHQSGANKVEIWSLFRSPPLVVVYAFAFVIGSTLGFFYAFHPIYSQEQGIRLQLLGLGVMLGSFSQFPFMLFFDPIIRRFGIANIFVFSGFVHAVRWLLYGFGLTPSSFILLWLLHGGTYMVLYLSLAEYVNATAPRELKASGQMMNALMLTGASRVVGSALGGAAANYWGIGPVFAFNGLLCLVAAVGLYAVVRFTDLFQQPTPVPGTREGTAL